MNKEIEVKLPEGFMNIAVTIENNLIADTNDSQNWDTIKIPLPEGCWSIFEIDDDNTVTIVNSNHIKFTTENLKDNQTKAIFLLDFLDYYDSLDVVGGNKYCVHNYLVNK